MTVAPMPDHSAWDHAAYFVAGRRAPLPLHGFLKPCVLSIPIANSGVNAFQNLTLVIPGTPKPVGHPADVCKHFVEVPAPFLAPVRSSPPLLRKFSSQHRTEPVPPVPRIFMADPDPALLQQIFDISTRQREPSVPLHSRAQGSDRVQILRKAGGFALL